MFFEERKKILTLISSEACNLQCRYCEISATTAKAHQNENLKIRQAMEDGSLIQNIKAIYQKYGFFPNDIERMSLWGEEPTLTLDSFCIMFPELRKFFPNLEELFFSTNGIANTTRILQLIDCINNTLNEKNNFTLDLQISYDGKWATNFNRGVNPIIIENNIKYFINELNKRTLKDNFKIIYTFHFVVDLNVINHVYEEANGVYNYYKELYDFQKQFKELTINKNVISHGISEGIIAPYNATKEEGILFAQFMNESYYIIRKYFPDVRTVESGIMRLITGDLKNMEESIGDYKKDLEKLVFDILTSRKTHFHSTDTRHPGCEPQCRELKIRYNGQMIHCHNDIFGLNNIDNQENPDKQKRAIRAMNLKHNSCPNLLTDSIEDIKKYDERWKYLFSNECVPQLYAMIVDFMTILAEIGQIDQSYILDRKKLLRHAYILLQIYNCWENNLSLTGSIYGEDLGKIRMYANGFLDFLENKLIGKYNKGLIKL